MASGSRCDTSKATLNGRGGDAPNENLTTRNNSTTPVCRATTGPDSELTGLRQADEGCVSPTAGGRKRAPAAPTTSRYFLRSSRAPPCAGDTRAGPGMRPATSSITVAAKKTRSRRTSSDGVERQKTAGNPSIGRSSEDAGKKRGKGQQKQMNLAPRMKRTEVKNRLLSPREVQRLGTWNVRTLRGLGKPEQLASEMKRYKLSVLAVTETHISGEGKMPLDEEGRYTMIFSGRQDGRSAEGVGLALSPQAQAALRHHQSVSSRIMTAEFLTHVGPLMIIVVYAPTNQDSAEEKDRFYGDLNCIMSRGNGQVMVMGDFNASVSERLHGVVGPYGLECTTSDNGERLLSFACANGLCLTNTYFPHKRIHQATWYPPDPSRPPSLKDYILVKQRMMPSVLDTRVFRGADIDSDHRLVVISIRLKLRSRPKEKRGRHFDVKCLQDAATKAAFVNTIEQGFQGRRTEGSIEDRWKNLKQCILESGEKHLGRKKKKQKNWISDSTMQIIDTKRKAYRQWQECRTDAGRQNEYRTLRKAVRKAVKDDREKWLRTMMKETEDSLKRNRQGDFFRKLRDINADKVKPTSTILDESGQPIKDNEEKLARWKRHFDEVLNVKSIVEEEVTTNVEDRSTSDTAEVTREEVKKAMSKLKNGKAAGSDEIVAELVKNGGEAMVDWLWELLREVWRTKQIPQEWKNAILIPLHKKKDRKVCDNYRGIALLSVPGKVLSLILLERLENIIDPQLLESQCGFRQGRGTIDQIWLTRQIIERAVEYETAAYLCFVDLTKAYDSVDRAALIAILKSYKVPRQLIDIIQEMYTNTWCQVRTAEGTSEEFQVQSGVRQGCVLSPLLFNCFMDRVLRDTLETTPGGWSIEYTTTDGLFLTYRDKTTTTSDVQNVQYADDLTLVAESGEELQFMVDTLDKACTRWGMSINGAKTKTMRIGVDDDDQPAITLKGNTLEIVETFSYLGSEVGQTARVDGEVRTRLEKAATVYQMWRRKLFRSRNIAKRTKIHVFRVMVMSVLLYGAETWAITQQGLKRLHAFQMKCLRDIVGVTLWDQRRNEDILAETGELPMEDQLRLKRLQWFGHLQRMPDHRPQRQVLKCRPEGKKRKPGGTSLRWIDIVNRDLSKIANWEQLVKDRNQWRSTIHQLCLPSSPT